MNIDFVENKNKKLGIFTDLHCGVEKDSTNRLLETEICIDWIIKEFKKEKVDWIIFLGDWFDSRFAINSKSLNIGIKCIEKLANEFEKVIIICGNHDAYYKNTNEINSVDFFEKVSIKRNIIIVSQQPYYIKILDKLLGFFPWSSEQLLIDEKYKNEICDYGFGHFEANGFLQPGGLSSGGKTEFKDLFKFANYIFSGHYHINKLYKNLSNKNNLLQMVGSPLQLNWSDYSLKKYIYTLNISNGEIKSFENNVNSIYNKIYYSKLENNEYTKKELEKLCNNNYIKLVIDKKSEFNKILKYNTDLKQYAIKSIETEYLISLTSDIANATTVELAKTKTKTNLDYLIEYIKKIYPDISKLDADISEDKLINMITEFYQQVDIKS